MRPHRPRSRRHIAGHALRVLPLVAILLLAAAPVAAQSDPVTVQAVEDSARVRTGETATLAWELTASESDRTVIASLDAEARGWNLTVTPRTLRLETGVPARLTVTAEAGARPLPRDLTVTLRLVVLDDTSDDVDELYLTAHVQAIGTTLVLGLWENPLPAPLDGIWGTFLANAVAWTIVAVFAMYAIDPTMRLLTRRTKTDLDDRIIRIIRFPVFIVLATYGLKQSLEVFDLPLRVFGMLDALWAIVLIIAGFYTAYRVWQGVIVHIGRRLASKTESRLDDRLIPVFEKVGGIIILIVGFFFLIDNLGFDMTIFAAGGVLGGMVIAFAAQDTLSNFFSGIQILTDQPFVEGDDILLDSGEVCTVRRIGLRSTELYHLANHEVILVPNNHLAQNRIINLLRPDTRYKVRVDVGVAYGSDVPLVKQTLLEIAREHPLTLKDDEHLAFVRFQAFGGSSLDFSLHVWVEDVYARWAVASDLREMIDERFAERAIEIPFPQQVNWDGAREAAKLAERRTTGAGRRHRPHQTLASARRAVGGTEETSGSEGGEGGGESV